MHKLAIVSVAALFSSLAFAGTTYEDLDTNKDGVISAEEAQANPDLAAKFKDLDKNQDSQLDAAEFAQFEMAPAPEQGAAQESTESAQ